MQKHHEDSIKIMIEHYRQDPEIKALFLIGSVATGTERPDSDLDGVAVIPEDYYDRKKNGKGTMEYFAGKCTYEGGYFDIHFKTRKQVEEILVNGSEPMRNMFSSAKVLFCDEPGLPEIVARIPYLPKQEIDEKKKRFYSTLKQFHVYFWNCCKPKDYYRQYVANGMIFCLYRLVLLENEILFPSSRKLEDTVHGASNKPDGLFELCHCFMKTLTDEDACALVSLYENWTTYDYPTDHAIVNNSFADPYEWY